MQNIPIPKTLFDYHSTGLTRSKPGTFSPDQRPSHLNPDPQGLPCLTRVLPTCPTCPTLFYSPGIQSLDVF